MKESELTEADYEFLLANRWSVITRDGEKRYYVIRKTGFGLSMERVA